jgi:hypothetical protein
MFTRHSIFLTTGKKVICAFVLHNRIQSLKQLGCGWVMIVLHGKLGCTIHLPVFQGQSLGGSPVSSSGLMLMSFSAGLSVQKLVSER